MSTRLTEVDYVVASAPDVAVRVHSAGLACCAVEVAAAVSRGLLVPAEGRESDTHVLVVAGTLTHAMVPAVQAAWDGLPAPRAAMSFGACANSGGPYWDSYSVMCGVDSMLPVASYVPGCPPHPEALIEAILRIARTSASAQATGGEL